MQSYIAPKKRAFDFLAIGLSCFVWVPVFLLCVAAILLLEGRPVFYVSRRRIFRRYSTRLVKFRTMRRDAERIANRDTVPVSNVRFLNIPIESPLYTPVGRLIERLVLTELPQIWHVLRGEMTLIGNRPLPENVIAALREVYPDVEDRFLSAAGLTGPAQLVGREFISDADRLMLETAYCRVAAEAYTMRLDFLILFYTVLIAVVPSFRFTPEEVHGLMLRHAGKRHHGWAFLRQGTRMLRRAAGMH